MADSILRLKVESQEYDAKLKRAADGIQRYAENCKKAGGTLEYLDEGVLEFTRALGGMETTARGASARLSELKKTFTDLSAQYNKLTEEEKQSPFGKALSESLDRLKIRIQDGSSEIKNINDSLNNSGGLRNTLDAVAGKFGLNIDQITKFGGVVGVTTTAIKVAKDAFFNMESGIDEWGRTVEGAKGAYNVFLDTLNNGNWSGFFQNLQIAIQGGRDLYDIFDRLGSIKSNNAAAIALVQQQIAQLRLAKQQGQNVDAQIKAATERLAMLQGQSVTAGKAAGTQSAFNVIRNGVNSIGGANINDATINYAIQRIMQNGQTEFDKYQRNRDVLYQKGLVTRTQTISDSQGGTYERRYKVFDINALTEEQQKQYALAKAITEGETRIQKGISVYAQAVQEGASSARETFKGNRYALQGSGGGSSKTFDISKIAFNPDKANVVKPADFIEQPSVWKQYGDGIRSAFEPIKDEMENLTEFTPNFNPYIKNMEKMAEAANKQKMAFNLAGQAADSFGAALASIDDPAAKAAGSVISAIANIALGFSMASVNANTAGTGWGWLAWVAAGASAMATTIATIHSLTGYAQGGEVKGNSFSGDNIPIMANAGEVVLTKAMQSNLASQLNGGTQNLNLYGVISGENIVLTANRYLQRKGKGELVTWRN